MEIETFTKKILVIYHSTYNDMASSAKRTLSLIKGLVDNGFQVDFLTQVADSPAFNANAEDDLIKKVNIILLDSGKPFSHIKYSKSIKAKILTKAAIVYRMVFIFGHAKKAAKNVKIDILPSREYEYVIAVSDPKTSHIVLNSLLRQGLMAKKVIEYWGDPLATDITLKSIYPKWLLRRIEKKQLELAKKIVYTSPFTLKLQKRLFPELAEMMSFVPSANINQNIYPKNSNEKFTAGYFGAYHSSVRNIIPLYDACKNLADKVKLQIVGDSDISLPEVRNINVLPRGDISEYEKKADLLVCVLNKRGTQIPGKVYYNASTNLPVLVVVDGDDRDEMKEYLRSFNRFYICDNNIESIETAINEIMESSKEWLPCSNLKPTVVAKEIIS